MACTHEWVLRIDWSKQAPESKQTVCKKCGVRKGG